jgi:PKD repeat protein
MTARRRRIRRFLLAAASTVLALSASGCHEAICGHSNPGWKQVFQLVGGVYRCEQVRDDPKPTAIVSYASPVGARELARFDGSGSYPSIGETIERYEWDLDDDGKFDDGEGERVETTFTEPGNHIVHLLVTDSAERRDRRAVTVTVVARSEQAPVAFLDPSSRTTEAGGTITFDPGRSYDPDGRIVEYQYDLDGAVGNERTAARPDPVSFTYEHPGTYRVSLRLIDDDNLSSYAFETITVTPRGGGSPVDFTIDPNPAPIYDTVTFDASASGAGVARYDWDFDGDGTFEYTTGDAKSEYVYGETFRPGQEVPVTLHVLRTGGETQRVTKTVTVVEPRPRAKRRPGPGGATAAGASKRRFRATLTAAPAGDRGGTARRRGRTFSLSGQPLVGELRGRLLGRGAATDPLARFLQATWVGRLSLTATPARRTVSLRVLGLAMFERTPGNACVRLNMRVRGRRRSGTLTTLGGSEEGAALATRASFRWGINRRGVIVLSGSIQGRTGPPRPLSRSCSALLVRP